MNNIVDGGHGLPSEVDTAPLAKWSSRYSIHTLVRIREDRLVLRATNLVRGLSITFFVIATVILLGWAETNTLDEIKARRGRAGVGGLFLILGCGAWLAPQRVVFDRRRGHLSRRSWFVRFRYPLADIVAVQIIYGGRHKPSKSAGYETRELNLVLNSSYAPRVNLTNHADHPTTRRMAAEIARFLDVPVWDAFAREVGDATVEGEARARAPVSKLAARLRWLAGCCYLAAFAAGFFCVVLSLQQAKLDELEATIRPVRARLVATEVKEWIEGNDDWSAFGTFQIESGEFQGRAEGSLIPQSFYESRLSGRSRGSYSTIPRGEAAKFLAPWEIGKTYDGYIHADARDHIFFELPGAELNALRVRQLRNTSGIFLTLALVASGCVAYASRRRKEGRIDTTVSTDPGD